MCRKEYDGSQAHVVDGFNILLIQRLETMKDTVLTGPFCHGGEIAVIDAKIAQRAWQVKGLIEVGGVLHACGRQNKRK